MSEPVCQLDEFFLTRLRVDWVEPPKNTKTQLRFGFDYTVGRHKDDPCRYRLQFRVTARSNEAQTVGLALDTEIVGFFTLPKDMDPDKREYQIRVNGCTLLYGILRGQLATVTGSFPGGKFILPTFMMQDVVADVEKRRAATPAKLATKARPRK